MSFKRRMLTGLPLAITFYFFILSLMWAANAEASYFQNMPDALVVFGTLVLAGAAFWSIWNTNEQEKRRVRQSQLRDVITWATDVHSVLSPLSSLMDFDVEHEQEHHMKVQAGLIEQYQSLYRRGEYISMLASRLEKQLGLTVDDVVNNIRKRELLLTKSMVTPLKGAGDIMGRMKYIHEEAEKVRQYLGTKDQEILDSMDTEGKVSIALGENAGTLGEAITTLWDSAINLMLETDRR